MRAVRLLAVGAALMVTAGWAHGRLAAERVRTVAGPIHDRIVARGIVVPVDGVVEVRPRIDGRVVEVMVREGDAVVAGQVLAHFDPVELTPELRGREAEGRAAAASAVAIAEGARREEIAALDAESTAAKLAWELDAERARRAEELFASQALSRAALDEALQADRIGRARFEVATSRLRLARAGGRSAEVRAARERSEAARAATAQARHKLGLTRIVSPVAGQVVARRIDPGDTVLAESSPPLFEIADAARTELRIEVEELDARNLAVGLPATVTLPGGRTLVGHGRTCRVNPRLERRTIDVDLARLRADGLVRAAWMEWADGDGASLPLGQRVDVVLELPSRPAGGLLPRCAVRVRGGRALVRVPWGPWVNERPVELGAVSADLVEVRGLEPGTTVLAWDRP